MPDVEITLAPSTGLASVMEDGIALSDMPKRTSDPGPVTDKDLVVSPATTPKSIPKPRQSISGRWMRRLSAPTKPTVLVSEEAAPIKASEVGVEQTNFWSMVTLELMADGTVNVVNGRHRKAVALPPYTVRYTIDEHIGGEKAKTFEIVREVDRSTEMQVLHALVDSDAEREGWAFALMDAGKLRPGESTANVVATAQV